MIAVDGLTRSGSARTQNCPTARVRIPTLWQAMVCHGSFPFAEGRGGNVPGKQAARPATAAPMPSWNRRGGSEGVLLCCRASAPLGRGREKRMAGHPDLWRTEPDGVLAAELGTHRLIVQAPEHAGGSVRFMVLRRDS